MTTIPVPKFQIGETVFYARVSWGSRQVTCPDCLGTREWKVILPSGEEFQHACNTCKHGWESTGKVEDWADHPTIREQTIGSVRIDTSNREEPVQYMCQETGVGSGSIYPEGCLFKTVKEAEAFCGGELIRVAGLRQAQELKERKRRKGESLIHGKRKKK